MIEASTQLLQSVYWLHVKQTSCGIPLHIDDRFLHTLDSVRLGTFRSV